MPRLQRLRPSVAPAVNRRGLCERRLELLAREGLQLTGDAPVVVPVRRPCPRCSQLWAYRKGDDGASLRTWALTVSEAGAKCGACDGHWSDLNWLARLLDGEPAAVG